MTLQDEIDKTLRPRKSGQEITVDFVLLLFNIVVSCIITLYGGLVLTQLWAWFAVPAGLPDITLKTAIGFMVIVTLATFTASHVGSSDEPDVRASYKAFYRSFLRFLAYTMTYVFGMLWNWVL